MNEHRFYQTLLLSEDNGSLLKIGLTKLEEGTARLEPVLLHSTNRQSKSYNGRASSREATPENFPYMLFTSFFERLCPLRALLTSKRMPFSFDRRIIRTISGKTRYQRQVVRSLCYMPCVGRICNLLAMPSDIVPYLSGTLETNSAISFAYQFSEPAICQERDCKRAQLRSKSHTQRLFLKPITNLQSKCPQTKTRRTRSEVADVRRTKNLSLQLFCTLRRS